MKLTANLWRRFINDSLYRNSLYLLLNMGVNTVSGFIFMLICTRLYPQEEVGYAIAMISALGLALSFSNIGMNRTIARFFGTSDTKSRDMATKISLIICTSLLVSIVMSFFFKPLGFKDTSLVTAGMFVVTVLASSVKALFDNAFVATRLSSGVLISSVLSNVTKLALPFVLVAAGFMGIFGAILASTVMSVVASIYVLRSKANYKLLTRPSHKSLQGKWRFAFGSYSSELIGNLPISIVPLIVISQLGPKNSALWYAAMQFTNFLLMVSSSVNQAMFAEMSNSKSSIYIFIKKASIVMYGLMIPLSICVSIFAADLLGLMGKEYVAAAPLLRLMAMFALIGVANYITGSILAYYKKVLYLTFVNVCNAAVVIAYCLWIASDLKGIAFGWMWGEVANVALFVGGAAYMLRKGQKL